MTPPPALTAITATAPRAGTSESPADDWREVPKSLSSTASREKWLAERYRDLFPTTIVRQALPMESSSGFTRFLVQAATHQTANDRLPKSCDDVMKLSMKPREKVEDMARILARDLAGQEVTPELVQSLGLLLGASLDRIRSACQHTLALGLASRCDPDGTVAILPREEQPNAPRDLFH